MKGVPLMLAIIALICFVLATFNVALGDLDVTALGLAFLAAHFILGGWPWGGAYPWQRRS
jgi:hypothetical protein